MSLLINLVFLVCNFASTYAIADSNDRRSNCQHQQNPVSRNLSMDEALVTIVSKVHHLTIDYQSLGCWQCPLEMVCQFDKQGNASLKVDTRLGSWISVRDTKHSNESACDIKTQLVQYGEYELLVSSWPGSTKPLNCTLIQLNAPLDAYIPIYAVLGAAGLAIIVWIAVKLIYRQWLHKTNIARNDNNGSLDVNSENNASSSGYVSLEDEGRRYSSIEEVTPISSHQKKRLKCIDTFRGFSLVIMIFVNYGGGGYWFFAHSSWNGLTVADLVFPWFIFIMGSSMALVSQSNQWLQSKRHFLLRKVLRRSALLFLLGLLISNTGKAVTLETVRIPGVLQRFSITYLVLGLLLIAFRDYTRHDVPLASLAKWRLALRDILPFWPEWLVVLGCVLLHCVLTFAMPLGDSCPTGYIGPGGLHAMGRYENCTGGAAGVIDRWFFGNAHIYHHPSCSKLYACKMPYDPEGALGTLMSIFLAYLGLQAGRSYAMYKKWKTVIHRWLIWAVISFFVAGILSQCKQNEGWIPINKNLWSLTYVLAMASASFVLLSVLFFLTDVIQLWSGAPFIYPGMNSIVIYVGHELLESSFPVQFHVDPNHGSLLAMNLWGSAFWTIVAWLMYYNQCFIAL